MADAAPGSHSDEFAGLFQTDAVELAAMSFGRTFVDASLADPLRELKLVDRAVAELGGVDLYRGLFGTAKLAIWERIQPYTLEVITVWQQARVAAQLTTAGQYGAAYVSLLRRGEQLLHAADPVAVLRGYLPGVELR